MSIFSLFGFSRCLVCNKWTREKGCLCSPACVSLWEEALDVKASMQDNFRCDICGECYCNSRCQFHDVVAEENGCEFIDSAVEPFEDL